MNDKLLEHLIKVKNESGSIRSAPNVLKTLESKVEGLPFQLDVPSISNLLSTDNMMGGIMKYVQQFGTLQGLGGVDQLVAKVKEQVSQSGLPATPENMVAMAGTVVTPEQLKSALGDVNALAMALWQ
jgi:hypothetical protein